MDSLVKETDRLKEELSMIIDAVSKKVQEKDYLHFKNLVEMNCA